MRSLQSWLRQSTGRKPRRPRSILPTSSQRGCGVVPKRWLSTEAQHPSKRRGYLRLLHSIPAVISLFFSNQLHVVLDSCAVVTALRRQALKALIWLEQVVVGVTPQVLAVMLTDIAMKDHERHKAPHERSTERELVRQLDSQTKVSAAFILASVSSCKLFIYWLYDRPPARAVSAFFHSPGLVGCGQVPLAPRCSRDAVRRALGAHRWWRPRCHCTNLHRAAGEACGSREGASTRVCRD